MFVLLRAFYAKGKHYVHSMLYKEAENAVNTSVLGMLAKSIDACDNLFCSTSLRSMLYMDACDKVSCSTSLHGMLYKEQKCCKYQCFGHDRQRQ